MAGANVGTAYITVVPSMKGFATTVQDALDSAFSGSKAKKIGEQAGSTSGAGFASGFKKATTNIATTVSSALAKTSSGLSTIGSKAGSTWQTAFIKPLSSISAKITPYISKISTSSLGTKAGTAWQTAFVKPLSSISSKISPYLTKISTTAKTVGGNAASFFQSNFVNNLKNIPSKVNSVFSSIKSYATSSGKTAGTFWNTAFATAFGTGITDIISSAFNFIADSVSGAVSRLDTLNSFPKTMESLGYSSEEAANAISTLSDGLQGLPTSLDEAATNVKVIANATGDLESATDIFLAFNDALVAGGASTAVQSSAMEQFTQVLAAGKVDAVAWNSIVTAMPGQMQALAESMLGAGASTEDLKTAIQEGELTLTDFTNELVRMDSEGSESMASFAEQAQTASGGIQTSYENMQTAFSRGLEAVLDAVGSENIQLALETIGSLFETAAETVANFINKFKDSGFIDNAAAAVENFMSWFQDTSLFQFFVDSLETCKGALEGVAQWLGDVVEWLGQVDWSGWEGDLFETIAAAITAAATALGLWRAATTLATTAQAIFNAVMSANPLMLIVTLIAAVVTALIYFFTQTETGQQIWQTFCDFISGIWETITSVAETVWNAISEFFSTTWEALKAVWETVWGAISSFFSTIWNTIQSVVSTVVSWISNFITTYIQTVQTVWQTVWNTVKSVFTTVWNAIKSTVSTVINTVKSTISNALDTIRNTWDTVWNKVKSIASNVWNKIKTTIQNAIDNVKEKITGIKVTVTEFFSKAIDWLKDAGWDLIKGLWNGIQNAKDWVIGKISGFIDDVTSAIKGFFGISSPSKLMEEMIGQWIPPGIALGIEATWDEVPDTISGLVDDLNEQIAYDLEARPQVQLGDIDLNRGKSATSYPAATTGGHTYNVTIDGAALQANGQIMKILQELIAALQRQKKMGVS